MKILLINPPFQRIHGVKNSYFPLGLGYLAAVLNLEGYYVRIYNGDIGDDERMLHSMSSSRRLINSQDMYIKALADKSNYVWREVSATLKEYEPDVIGITTMSPTYPSAKIVAELSKAYNKDCIVIIGGIHPTILFEDVVEDNNIDFVVIGEGERTIVELVSAIKDGSGCFDEIDGLAFKRNGKAHFTKKREFINDLDSLPHPARDLVLRPDLYSPDLMGAVISSRGCPFDCSFCNAQSLWTRKARYRSVSSIMSEIGIVRRKYKAKLINFVDDTLTAKKTRLIELCNALVARGGGVKFTCYSRADILDDELVGRLRSAGCISINMGIESGSERMLRIMNKKITIDQIEKCASMLKKNNIEFNTTFIVGTPDETEEDIRKTIALIKWIRPDFTNVCTYTPYPGSKMYQRAAELNMIPKDIDWSMFSHHSRHNRFIRGVDDVSFEKLRSELVSVANRYNRRITFKMIARLFHNNWRLIFDNPEELLKKAASKCVGAGRMIMHSK